MTCRLCGGDPDAPVRERWELFVPIEPPSQNDIQARGPSLWGRTLRHKYRKLRDEYTRCLGLLKAHKGVPDAKVKRRVRLVRVYRKRQRPYDHANLVGGCKPIVDAMVESRLLVDDTAAWLEDHYAQEKGPQPGLRVVIEELA